MINRIYGILSCGVVDESVTTGRYSNATAGDTTAKHLNELLSNDPEIRGYQIEVIIWLLRSHYSWIKLVRDFDPDNTYDSVIPIDKDHRISFRRLYDWAVELPAVTNDYTIGATINDIPIDLVVDRLIGLITTNN